MAEFLGSRLALWHTGNTPADCRRSTSFLRALVGLPRGRCPRVEDDPLTPGGCGIAVQVLPSGYSMNPNRNTRRRKRRPQVDLYGFYHAGSLAATPDQGSELLPVVCLSRNRQSLGVAVVTIL